MTGHGWKFLASLQFSVKQVTFLLAPFSTKNLIRSKFSGGKAWPRVLDRSMYEVYYADSFKSFIEVKRDKETNEWVPVK